MPLKSTRYAILFGAYGGDHLGDAAILGGVLMSLAERYGVSQAFVCSFRPSRTRRLTRQLDTGVQTEVIPFDFLRILRLMRGSSYLVWAGGPITNRPRLLWRNLALILLARVFRVPVILDRIGINEPDNILNRTLVRLAMACATNISARSQSSARAVARLSGRECVASADPAFDYCRSREGRTAMTDDERRRVDDLTMRPQGTILVCVNARPATRASRTADFSRLLSEFAHGLSLFAGSRRTRFVFIPMEDEVDPGRDIDAANEMANYLNAAVDFRVWRPAPSIDAMLRLLRSSDGAVTMRLHAAIFALSQGVPTLGIDYSKTGSGKVAELFEDRGEAERVIRIQEMNAGRLTELLTRLVVEPKGSSNQDSGDSWRSPAGTGT